MIEKIYKPFEDKFTQELNENFSYLRERLAIKNKWVQINIYRHENN